MSEQQAVDQKLIINANYGTTNNIADEDSSKILSDTLFYIANILKQHCGPYGKFALIDKDVNTEPVFTKDGINIVRSIDFASPIQTFIKNQMVYIGSRIESKIGDGTTSSMIIFASALGHLIEKIATSGKRYSYNEILLASKIFIEKIEEAYKTVPISLKDFSEEDKIKAIKFIARNQALTSSHGDIEISEAMEEAFTVIPEAIFDHIAIDKEGFETDKRISLFIDSSQYSVGNMSILNENMLNYDMRTKYKAKNILTYVNPIPLMDGSPSTSRIMEAIDKALEEKSKLAICIPYGTDNVYKTMLMEKLKNDEEHNVAVFEFPYNTKEDHAMNIIILSGSVYESNNIYAFNLDLDFTNHTLCIEGLYENPTNSVIHPFFGDKTNHKQYNEYIEALNKLIEKYKAAPVSEANTKYLNTTSRTKNNMYLTKRATIVIGGNAYDSAAAVDVVVDCTLAIKSSMVNGFVFGGNRTLYATIFRKILTLDIFDKKNKSNVDELLLYLSQSFARAIEDVIYATYPSRESADEAMKNIDTSSNVLELDKPGYSYEDIRSGKHFDISNVIIQPATTDIELIKRFIEVGLKFTNVARIISSSGYYIREPKNQQNS